jgi:hypothetical protein
MHGHPMPYSSEFDPEHRILLVILGGEQCPKSPYFTGC